MHSVLINILKYDYYSRNASMFNYTFKKTCIDFSYSFKSTIVKLCDNILISGSNEHLILQCFRASDSVMKR